MRPHRPQTVPPRDLQEVTCGSICFAAPYDVTFEVMRASLLLPAFLLAIAPLPALSEDSCAFMTCCCAQPVPEPATCCGEDHTAAPARPCTCKLLPFAPDAHTRVFAPPCPQRVRPAMIPQALHGMIGGLAPPPKFLTTMPAHSVKALHVGLSPPVEGPLFLALCVLRR